MVRLQNAPGTKTSEPSKSEDGRWLSNAPRLREALKQANSDVVVLLKYLSRIADGRLQANFEDTRVRRLPIVPVVPPCRTYQHFLSRIFLISEALEDVQLSEPQLPKQSHNDNPEGDENVDCVSFIYWCREFLAGLATPATVNSIQITQCYRENRLNQRTRTNELSGETLGFKEAADWIATNVRRLEWFGVAAAIVTLVISMYALAGQTINGAQKTAMRQVREAHDGVVRLEENDRRSALAMCGSLDLQHTEECTKHMQSLNSRRGALAICKRPNYRNSEECTEYMQSLTDLCSIGLQVQSWSKSLQAARLWQAPAIQTDKCRTLIFIDGPTLPSMKAPTSPSTEPQNSRARIMQETIGASAIWMEVILSCITLYIPPCLYGYLGSVVATMHHIRRRVDASTLAFTDRGRVSYGQFLGLIVGAVMGLFAAFVLKSDIGQSLGLSAVTFLAGYHVTRLVTFLDALSLATFGGAPSRATGAAPL
jgi:hypothetical protein